MRVEQCPVPGCTGRIRFDAAVAGAAAGVCPDCAQRVALVERLRLQIRSLHDQLIAAQGRLLWQNRPTILALAKRAQTSAELAAALGRAISTVDASLRRLEARGLVEIAEWRRSAQRGLARAVWKLSALGDRLVTASEASSNGHKPAVPKLRGRRKASTS